MTADKNKQFITFCGNSIKVPNNPNIPFIQGDGIGPDIWQASVKVFNAAVKKAYKGKREIQWQEVYAGEKAYNKFGEWLPQDTIDAFKKYIVGIKGPLTTPVGGGIRSLNVALRKSLDLYACIRPIKWFLGVPSPVKQPQDLNVVIFRENTEGIYTGIEFENGTADTEQLKDILRELFPNEFAKMRFPDSSGFSLKLISREGTERIMRAAINYAIKNNRKTITIVHKGNIMKFTDGAFCKWAYNLAEREFSNKVYTRNQWNRTKTEKSVDAANEEQELSLKAGELLIKDVIADIAFQQTLTRPKDFDVIVTTNLNGDYLSDALAAQVGGVGISPGGNINFETGMAIFEACHGTAPKYANKNVVNPSSLILSGELMLRYLGWDQAADLIIKGLGGAIKSKKVTYDFHRLMDNGIKVTTNEFGDEVINNM
ncbi:MAG TPA: NADP-dependent isocitrate dehydrogenase [Anaerolineae bacterium]|nr:NADP-dependent isocitrate dehydrogenase [Anaerolineae bacterium]